MGRPVGRLLTIASLAVALAVGPGASVHAQWLGLLGQSAEHSATGVGEIAGKNAAKAVAEHEAEVTAAETLADTSAERTEFETQEFGRDVESFQTADPTAFKSLQAAAAFVRDNDGALSQTAPFGPTLPFIRVRTTGVAAYDAVLLAFSHVRLDSQLNAPFHIDSLKVIPLAMADDAKTSSAEAGRYRRSLPRSMIDRVGPLSKLAAGVRGETSLDEKIADLRLYRGQTVIMVGHVPPDKSDFFVVGPDGQPQPLGIGEWLAAAAAAKVNLLPIGCNSGSFTPFGALGDINSDDVLQRLRALASTRPNTVGNFLRGITGDDLVLTVNPLEEQVFGAGQVMVERRSGKVVGRISLSGVSQAASDGIQRPAAYPLFGGCFSTADTDSFQGCVRATKTRFETERWPDIAAKAEAERQGQIEIYEGVLRDGQHASVGIVLARSLMVFGVLLASLGLPFAISVKATKEEDPPGRRMLFNMEIGRYFRGFIPGSQFIWTFFLWFLFLPFIFYLSIDVMAIMGSGMSGDDGLPLFIICYVLMGFLIVPSFEHALIKGSEFAFIMGIVFVFFASTQLGGVLLVRGFEQARVDADNARQSLAPLRDNGPTAAWRQDALAELEDQ